MIFGRVKSLDAILAAAEQKSLKRTLGWFQLTLFGIGCVIGTGMDHRFVDFTEDCSTWVIFWGQAGGEI